MEIMSITNTTNLSGKVFKCKIYKNTQIKKYLVLRKIFYLKPSFRNVENASSRLQQMLIRNSNDFEYPEAVELETTIWYDRSLLDKFKGNHARVKGWLTNVIMHAKEYLRHPSLVVKVVLIPGEKLFFDRKIIADDNDIDRLSYENYNDKANKSVLNSYFSYDICNGRCTTGAAWTSDACSKSGFAVNINEYYTDRSPALNTGKTFVHEIGHNLGML